jgi:uncharacterized protein YndB with AHSA1/START domain
MASNDRTIRLHRVMRAPAERVYKAFLDPRALVKWMAPHGYIAEVHSMDPRVGGGYRMSFANLGTGHSHSFGGKYLELVPNQRIKHTDAFDDPSMPGEMLLTVALRPVTGGTDLSITQENVPEQIPLEMCYMGWQESLLLLTLLVEAEVH